MHSGTNERVCSDAVNGLGRRRQTTKETLYQAGQQLTEVSSTIHTLCHMLENTTPDELKYMDQLRWVALGAARSVDAVANDIIDLKDDLEETTATTTEPININLARTSDVKDSTTKLLVLLAALQRINGSRKYYSEISFLEDIPHNMETLFNELDALHGMFFEEVVELEERAGVRK